MPIIDPLIGAITGLSSKGPTMLFTRKSAPLIEEFIELAIGKNSNGLFISKFQYGNFKWDALIISLFLTSSGYEFYLRLDMLEFVKQFVNNAHIFKWSNHLAHLVK